MILNFNCIRYFISGYFHQDWDIYGSTDKDVIAYFVNKEPLDQVNTLISELESLLELDMDNETADMILKESGCEYYFQADGLNAMDWFSRIEGLLKTERTRLSV